MEGVHLYLGAEGNLSVGWRSCPSYSRCFKKAIGRENVKQEWLLSVFKAVRFLSAVSGRFTA